MKLEEMLEQFDSFDTNELGSGGQKCVYRGVHNTYGPVVVKRVLKPSARIEREINIVSQHAFDNVPKIFEALNVDWDGVPSQVILEEYVEGTSLAELIRNGRTYDMSEIVRFLRQGFAFLEQISSQGIIHRDIKPDNILVTDDGKYVFIDFGIARDLESASLTRTGDMSPLTPGYAAPELYLGEKREIDVKVDLFSIGTVAYELVTGSNPFRPEGEDNLIRIFSNTMTITPLDFHLEGDDHSQLMGLISALMSKERYRRPRDAKQAMEWLDRTVDELSLEV